MISRGSRNSSYAKKATLDGTIACFKEQILYKGIVVVGTQLGRWRQKVSPSVIRNGGTPVAQNAVKQVKWAACLAAHFHSTRL